MVQTDLHNVPTYVHAKDGVSVYCKFKVKHPFCSVQLQVIFEQRKRKKNSQDLFLSRTSLDRDYDMSSVKSRPVNNNNKNTSQGCNLFRQDSY